ncbi:uncharacterized protein LOC110969636 [Acanthochromis polyacanthus]|uniref:uncharacterized protein LOC110969636 n=1 Tax=Acanthochromis polyacanthus TaxID=80966 RepID=UPI002233ED8F|nr:uncharacterized protein LOC110969636 [Acanthochromis polyacanthus]XP_051816754.1 uncharacterized protein LOC110969636 [Acanthochromis polyacanthus]
MDNGNTSGPMDRKRMTANTVWQWRIMHVKKYSRNPEPFHYSNTMGLDFNVGIATNKKLDLQVVTNGVILEICDFAKTVKKSRRHFATSILENNYDLGLENEQQRIYFTNQLLHKLKDLRRKPPTNEVFPLFETYPNPECKKNRRQVEMRVVEVEDDSDPEDMFICSQLPSQEVMEEMDEPLPVNMEDTKPEPAEKPKPDVLPFRFPCCEAIGLSFDTELKQILDPGLLTKAAMWELVDFTIVLTASYRSIILAILDHNFNLELKSQQGKDQVCFLVSQLLKRRKQLYSTGIKISSKFQNEPFSFQSNPLKRAHGTNEFEEVAKRKMLDFKSDVSWQQGDKIHKHVLTNGPNKWDVDQEEMVTESNMWRLRVKRVRQILLELDMEYCPFFRPKKIDLEFNIGFRPERYLSAEFLTNSVLYKVARFALAMSSSQREFVVDILENNFNLGLQSKRQKFTFGCKVMSKVRRLKNCEDAIRFSREVFELPLSALLVNPVKQSKSSSKIKTKELEAASTNAPDSHAQSKPGSGSTPNSGSAPDSGYTPDSGSKPDAHATSNLDSGSKPVLQTETEPASGSKSDSNAETEADSIWKPDSQAESEPDSGVKPYLRTKSEPDSESEPDLESEPHSHSSVELYPFCREIGLNLHEIHNRSISILDINRLTNGAMMEVADFAEQLCGTFEQISLDVLRHNFDLNLKSVDSELFRKILAHIPVVIMERNLATCVNHAKFRPKRNDESVLMRLDYKSIPDLEPCSSGSNTVQNVSSSTDIEQQNDPNFLLWRLRTNRIHQIVSVPHGERCPLYSFPRCKKLGINFNVASGLKQNLDPKLLTNGVMVEVNAFAAALQLATKHFMAEIIEYNFHLRFKGELHRSAYAERLLREILLLKSARSTVPRQNMTYHLPDPRFIEEESPSCPKCYQDRKYKRYPADSDRSVHPLVVTDTVSATQQPTTNPAEEKLMSKYNNSRRIGLRLCLERRRRKYKLNPDLLTCKVMMEVYIFARKLSGTKHKIVNDVLEHNFNIDMQNKDINPSTQFSRIAALNASLSWFNEVFVIQPCSHRDPAAATNRQDLSKMQASQKKETCRKRQMELHLRASKRLKGCPAEEGEEHYMCPVEGDELSDSEKSENEDLLEIPTSSHISEEAESIAEGSPTVSTQTNPTSQPDQSHLQGGEVPMEIPTNVLTEYELRPEGEMWRLRSNRMKEILALIEKDFSPVFMRKKVDLEFNAGLGPRRNFNGENLTNSLLYKITGFALAMSSSQREFIVEILENNFDLNLQSKHQKYAFGCEVMKRLRRLKNCKDAIRFEVFGLPVSVSSGVTVNHSMNSVHSELSSMSGMKDHEDTPDYQTRTEPDSESKPDSKVESEPDSASKPDSQSSVELYPFCKAIGLNLHVNSSRPNPKLQVSKLTKGAMIEVVDFANQLCGTFEQICLDILRHNFDFDLETTDSELFRKILAYIPALVVQRNLATSITYTKTKPRRKDHSVLMKMQQQNSLDSKPCSYGSVQTKTVQNMSSSTGVKQKNDPNSLLWRLRTDRIQQILSVPHGERCPLYSFSRCKKLGINFYVGSGRKQNLDPKLLTNGVMVELNVFAEALQLAIKDFITDIVDYNFSLHLSGELHRSAFAVHLRRQVVMMNAKRVSVPHKKMPFELPDSSCMEEETVYCPSCYRDRNYKRQTNLSADAQNSAMESTFRAAEATLLTSYHNCREVGLSLCVDKNHPKQKLNPDVLTWAVMSEVYSFCKKLRGTKNRVVNEIVEHNFNVDLESLSLKPYEWFSRVAASGGELAWFDEVLQPPKYTPRTTKPKVLPVVEMTDRKEMFRKRQLEMQTKKERATLESEKANAERLKQIEERNKRRYPLCREIGLDLDMTKQTADKKKLHLRHLTRNVMMEIHSFIFRKGSRHFQSTLYEILNYNFDLSSQDYRRWQFANDIATKVKAMIKDPKSRRRRGGNGVFKLPFAYKNTSRSFTQIQQNRSFSLEEAQRKANEANQVQQVLCFSDVTRVFVLNDVQIKDESWFGGEDAVTQTEPGTASQTDNGQIYGNLQIKEEEFDPCYAEMMEENNVKTESNTEQEPDHEIKTEDEDVQCYVPPAPPAPEGSRMVPPNSGGVELLQLAASLGYTMVTIGQDTPVKEEQQEGVDSASETEVKQEP